MSDQELKERLAIAIKGVCMEALLNHAESCNCWTCNLWWWFQEYRRRVRPQDL